MKQTLEQLIKLQEIDQRLLEIKEHMGDLPITVETQELEVASLQSENEQKQSRIEEIEKEIRHHENEIEDYTTKLEKYKEQLFLVKSNNGLKTTVEPNMLRLFIPDNPFFSCVKTLPISNKYKSGEPFLMLKSSDTNKPVNKSVLI